MRPGLTALALAVAASLLLGVSMGSLLAPRQVERPVLVTVERTQEITRQVTVTVAAPPKIETVTTVTTVSTTVFSTVTAAGETELHGRAFAFSAFAFPSCVSNLTRPTPGCSGPGERPVTGVSVLLGVVGTVSFRPEAIRAMVGGREAPVYAISLREEGEEGGRTVNMTDGSFVLRDGLYTLTLLLDLQPGSSRDDVVVAVPGVFEARARWALP
ncbi:MAG: hypothetical protein QXP81_09655 [Nitrososphaerota archaeon]